MNKQCVLITGSAGLIGSEAVKYYAKNDWDVIGIDNDCRAQFFGSKASTKWMAEKLETEFQNYTHIDADIRDAEVMEEIFKTNNFKLIIHAAAQPSHDWAAHNPLTDFKVNTCATVGLLELMRTLAPEAVFVFMSTNKVYGDHVNKLPLIETETRFELPLDHEDYEGIGEQRSLDECIHSPYGASKLSADIYVQEFGRYYGLNTGIFRLCCVTGSSHCGTFLHGFLSYLFKFVSTGDTYRILGHGGKQVRDNIHAYDVVTAIDSFYKNPRHGRVYNVGGMRGSDVSIIEAISIVEKLLEKKANIVFDPEPRRADHKWYITNMAKFKKDFPEWRQKFAGEDLYSELATHEAHRSYSCV